MVGGSLIVDQQSNVRSEDDGIGGGKGRMENFFGANFFAVGDWPARM
jgi:hypothetical protein